MDQSGLSHRLHYWETLSPPPAWGAQSINSGLLAAISWHWLRLACSGCDRLVSNPLVFGHLRLYNHHSRPPPGAISWDSNPYPWCLVILWGRNANILCKSLSPDVNPTENKGTSQQITRYMTPPQVTQPGKYFNHICCSLLKFKD